MGLCNGTKEPGSPGSLMKISDMFLAKTWYRLVLFARFSMETAAKSKQSLLRVRKQTLKEYRRC